MGFKKRRTFSSGSSSSSFPWLRFWAGLCVFVLCATWCGSYLIDRYRSTASSSAESSTPDERDDLGEDRDSRDENGAPHDGDQTTPPGPDNGVPSDDSTHDPSLPPPPQPGIPPISPTTPEPTTEATKLNAYSIPIQAPEISLSFPSLPPIIPDGPSADAIWDINELARGLNLKTELNFIPGSSSSSVRNKNENYRATLRMDVVLPKPTDSLADIAKINPHIAKIFPQHKEWETTTKVSRFYHQLMANKQSDLRKKLTSFNKLLTRHNFYDCETILEITHPTTKRKLLWIQSEMDVVSDGSDGDRLPEMPKAIVDSPYYQPFTSYRWKKQSTEQNPLLPAWEKRLAQAQKDLKTAPRTQTASLTNSIATFKRGIEDMKANSFLIAEYDPFIVIPLGVLNNVNSDFAPSPGDYAVVIYKNKLYPAIVGDAGPSFKIGEASLRIAQEINPKASPYNRPVSDLLISYLVFPKSAEPEKSAPDYALWKRRCEELLTDMGGLSPTYTLHEWVNKLPVKEEPPSPVLPPDIKAPVKPGISPPPPAHGRSGSTNTPASSPRSGKTNPPTRPSSRTTPSETSLKTSGRP